MPQLTHVTAAGTCSLNNSDITTPKDNFRLVYIKAFSSPKIVSNSVEQRPTQLATW